MRIGILAAQGAFEEHRSVLQSLGADTILLRQKSDIGTSGRRKHRTRQTFEGSAYAGSIKRDDK